MINALPASIHIEAAILGAMMGDALAINDATAKLVPEDFSLESHQRVYRCMMGMLAAGRAIDYLSVQEELTRLRHLDSIGGPAYLAFLTEGIPRNFNIENYVRIVKDKSVRRREMAIGEAMSADAADSSTDTAERLQSRVTQLQELAADGESDLESIGQYLDTQGSPEQLFERMATTNGIPLGWKQWDTVTHGAQPGRLIVIAARPAMGKTAAAANAAYNVAVKQGKVVAHFTMEDSIDDLLRRMMSFATGVAHNEILSGTVREYERYLLMEQRQILHGAPLYLCERPKLTVSRIRSFCSRLQRQRGLSLILIDQLSRIGNGDVPSKITQRHEVVGWKTDALKLMAKELNVPVVLFVQLSRESTKRADPTPVLSDLRESGNIEEDADVVTFLHRPSYYDRDYAGTDKMIVAKLRQGVTGAFDVNFNGAVQRWSDAG